ncbi:MAG: hypothetical protein ACKOTB_00155 [Planctomycetia bacterium]
MRWRVWSTPRLLPTPGACAGLAIVLGAIVSPVGPAAADGGAEPTPAEIAALVESLGAADYAEREAAAKRLGAIGPAAVDPLLAAAELSTDLEIAMRARWLVDTIPIDTAADPPEVVKLLEHYKRKPFAERVQIMHRLLRVDDDGGIEPLARIVRLDRSPLGSRVAAALLCREWRADDPYWPQFRGRIAAGLGASGRPASVVLRARLDLSAAATDADRAASLTAARESLDRLANPPPGAEAEAGGRRDLDAGSSEGDASAPITETTRRIFDRCLIQMLLAAHRRDDALAQAAALLARCHAQGEEAEKDADTVAEEIAGTLSWLVEHGLPEAIDGDLPPDVRDDPLVAYSMALAERSRGNPLKADELATAAFAKPAGSNAEFVDRLQTALLLAKWGAADWADREYASLLENPRAPVAQFTLGSIMYSEFLHDQERESEAATCLERLLEGRQGKGGDARGIGAIEPFLQQIGRDPRSIQSRLHFFKSCAAAAKGDAADRRKSLEQSLRAYASDVDSLIALYGLADNTPEQKAAAVRRVQQALEHIDNEIQAVRSVSDDVNSYNEYAWLVANTQGDLRKAIRYSKISLVKSFDSSSYLDTLAHCHFAAGDKAAAVRTQSLALRQEPHNRTIRRNYDRFRAP